MEINPGQLATEAKGWPSIVISVIDELGPSLSALGRALSRRRRTRVRVWFQNPLLSRRGLSLPVEALLASAFLHPRLWEVRDDRNKSDNPARPSENPHS